MITSKARKSTETKGGSVLVFSQASLSNGTYVLSDLQKVAQDLNVPTNSPAPST